jgi:hypothetical protein
MLRTHRSLEAYCVTLWWWWFVSVIFPCNGAPVEWNWQGENRSTWGKTCPNASLSITNPTCTGPGSNPGPHVDRPATNCLSHGLVTWCSFCRDVSKEHAVSIVRVKDISRRWMQHGITFQKSLSHRTSLKMEEARFSSAFIYIYNNLHGVMFHKKISAFSALKVGAVHFSYTLILVYQTIRRHILGHLHSTYSPRQKVKYNPMYHIPVFF